MLALVYLFLPIAIVDRVLVQQPRRALQLHLAGLHAQELAEPVRLPGRQGALKVSIEIAFLSALVATALGTLIALALVRYKFKGSATTNLLIFVPMTTPEVVMGASLLTLFVNWKIPQGFGTILIAHILFNISYVVVTVRARLVGFDRHLEEAAMDLGANEFVTFIRVTLPLIMPGIIAAGLLAFALSIDDFVITYFNAGSTMTFPLFVWGAARVATPPQINVIGTAIFVIAIIGDAREHLLPEPPLSERSSSRMTLDLQQAARDHLWLHFTRMGAYGDAEVPIIVRGEGCYLEDSNGKRYLDALAGLFAVQLGYSHGDEIGQAAHEQMRELPFYTNWSYAHPRAIELAHERRAAHARRPEPRLLRLGRLRGDRVGLEARARSTTPPAASAAGRRSDAAPPTTARRWARSRSTASPRSRTPSSRSCRTRCTSATRTAITVPPRRRRPSSRRSCSTTSSRRSSPPGRRRSRWSSWSRCRTRAALHPARRLLPGRACDLRPLRDPPLRRRGDHGLRPHRHWFASEIYDIRPDLMTSAKGLSSAYASIGALIAADHVFEPFLDAGRCTRTG